MPSSGAPTVNEIGSPNLRTAPSCGEDRHVEKRGEGVLLSAVKDWPGHGGGTEDSRIEASGCEALGQEAQRGS